MNAPEPKEKTDAEVLFPEVEAGGFKVGPWTLGNVIDLAPIFRAMAVVVKERGIKPAEAEKRIPELLELALPFAPQIISVTVGITPAEARNLSVPRASVILLTIVSQNLEHLKNFFGLDLPKFRTVAAKVN
jgi:hypothetical protein